MSISSSELQNLSFHMAVGSPSPIPYPRDARALRRPRRVSNPTWQLTEVTLTATEQVAIRVGATLFWNPHAPLLFALSSPCKTLHPKSPLQDGTPVGWESARLGRPPRGRWCPATVYPQNITNTHWWAPRFAIQPSRPAARGTSPVPRLPLHRNTATGSGVLAKDIQKAVCTRVLSHCSKAPSKPISTVGSPPGFQILF